MPVVAFLAPAPAAVEITTGISETLFYWGIPYIKRYGKAIQAANWDQVKPEIKTKLEKDMKSLANKIKTSKVRVGVKTRFMFSMMRMMQIKNMGSGEEERNYWKEKGWLEKNRPWKV